MVFFKIKKLSILRVFLYTIVNILDKKLTGLVEGSILYLFVLIKISCYNRACSSDLQSLKAQHDLQS